MLAREKPEIEWLVLRCSRPSFGGPRMLARWGMERTNEGMKSHGGDALFAFPLF